MGDFAGMNAHVLIVGMWNRTKMKLPMRNVSGKINPREGKKDVIAGSPTAKKSIASALMLEGLVHSIAIVSDVTIPRISSRQHTKNTMCNDSRSLRV